MAEARSVVRETEMIKVPACQNLSPLLPCRKTELPASETSKVKVWKEKATAKNSYYLLNISA